MGAGECPLGAVKQNRTVYTPYASYEVKKRGVTPCTAYGLDYPPGSVLCLFTCSRV